MKKLVPIYPRTINDVMKRILFGFGLSICCLVSGYAQTSSCAQTLRLARSTYELGRLHEIPALIDGCLKNGFTVQEKVEALKLLTQTYIYLEEPEKAEESMLLLLQTDNYFEINEAIDPAELVALYRTFRTDPIYRIGLKGGAIGAQPNVVSSDFANEGTGKYKYNVSFIAGVAAEIPFTKRITLNPELTIQQKAFTNTNSLATSDGNFMLTAKQTLTYISLPLAVQYRIFEKNTKLNPYALGGVSVDYLISGNLAAERNRTGFAPIEKKTFSITPDLKKLNINIIAGAGIKYRMAGGYGIAEIRYNYGLFNANTKSSTYSNQELVFNYQAVDGIFKLNSLSFTLGYVHNIFSPKKLTVK